MPLRRPEAEEMATLLVREVRPLVEIGQEEVCLGGSPVCRGCSDGIPKAVPLGHLQGER